MELKDGLGNLHKWSLHEKVLTGMLSLRETDELVRRAGIEAGLVSQSEYPVDIDGYEKPKKIDWVWRLSRDDARIVAAFELDGLSIDGGNAEKALLTLSTLNPPLKYLLLFQVDHNFSWKGDKGRVSDGRSTEVDRRRVRFSRARICVRRDTGLMAGGIEEIIEHARASAAEMRKCQSESRGPVASP